MAGEYGNTREPGGGDGPDRDQSAWSGGGFEEPRGTEGAAGRLRREARDSASEVADQARTAAAGIAGDVTRQARAALDRRKNAAAGEVSGVADALRSTADTLRRQQKEDLGRYTERAARGLDEISRSLRERDIDELAQRLRSYARSEPALFLGGAVALGFALTRFFKASGERAPEGHPNPEAPDRRGTGSRAGDTDFAATDPWTREREALAVPSSEATPVILGGSGTSNEALGNAGDPGRMGDEGAGPGSSVR